jgi:WD40 repeat protein
MGLNFGPKGEFLLTAAYSDVTAWPLEGPVPHQGHEIVSASCEGSTDVAVSPDGELFAVASIHDCPVLVFQDGEEPQPPEGADELGPGSSSVTFSPDGRYVAAVTEFYNAQDQAVRVWEATTGEEVAVLRLEGEEFRPGSGFVADGRLITGSTAGVVAWDVETGEQEVLVDVAIHQSSANQNGRRLLVTEEGEAGTMKDPAGSPTFFDLNNGEATPLTTHGSHVRELALDREGFVATTGDSNGIIRVGPVTGEEPHLLLGHDGLIYKLAIDPQGRWIASSGKDNTVRLWPMPDLSKPPLHTLPREELIAKLKTLTNLRVVRDEESATGWTLTHDPFPGWETVPTW